MDIGFSMFFSCCCWITSMIVLITQYLSWLRIQPITTRHGLEHHTNGAVKKIKGKEAHNDKVKILSR